MTEQQQIFDYNTETSVQTPYSFEAQPQEQITTNEEVHETLAPLTEKELVPPNNQPSFTPLESVGNESFPNTDFQYESLAPLVQDNTGDVPPLTLTSDTSKPTDTVQTTDLTPIIDEIVNHETENLLSGDLTNETQTKDVGNNPTAVAVEEEEKQQLEKQPYGAQQDEEDEENTWSISAIKKMRLFPDQSRSTNDSPADNTVLSASESQLPTTLSTPTQELTRDSTDSQQQSKKRRKRIMVDESDESETEEIREEVQKSTEVSEQPQAETEEAPPSPSPSEASIDSIEALEQRVEELKAIERPGPRSKKTSTLLLREIEAKTLLQNAVVIPSKDKKHKKHKKNLNRVLESDEEEQAPPTIKTDLSDIGLFDDDHNNQERARESILVSENMQLDSDFVKLEGITMDDVGDTVPIENPILPEGEAKDDPEEPLAKDDDVIELDSSEHEEEPPSTKDKEANKATESETTAEPEIDKRKEVTVEKQNGELQEKEKSPTKDSEVAIDETQSEANKTSTIKIEPGEISNTDANNPSTPTAIKIKQENPDTPVTIKQEPCTTKEAETFLADALRSQFGCDEKSKSKSSSAPKEPVDPSSTFWGRDSTSEDSDEDWPATRSYSGYNKKVYKKSSSKNKKKRRYDSDSDDYNRHKRRSSGYVRTVNPSSFTRTPAPNALGRPNLALANQKPATIRVAVRSKEELKRKVKDRFFDRSRLVPNDIYFGDVQVPLHILHAYNSDAFDSSSDSDGFNPSNRGGYRSQQSQYNKNASRRPMGVGGSSMVIKAVPIQAYNSSKSHHSPSSSSASANTLIETFKRYLKAAGIKKVNYSKLWEGCHSNAERARAMLKLLRNKGLEGEPTLAKCRALKKKRKVEQEIKELDRSVIIDDDIGIKTRRSTRTTNIKKEDDIPVEAVETLNKLKQVVDSDSE